MKTPVTGSAAPFAALDVPPGAKVAVAPSSGMSPGRAGSATDVGASGGMVLWRNHSTPPAATSRTASNAIADQSQRRRVILPSGAVAGSVMSQMLHAWQVTHRL